MAMTLAELVVKISGDTSGLDTALGSAVAKTKAADRSMGKAALGTGKKWQMAGKVAALGLGVMAVGAVKAVGDASDLNESVNKAGVTFGKFAGSMPGFTKSVAGSLGMTRAERSTTRPGSAP